MNRSLLMQLVNPVVSLVHRPQDSKSMFTGPWRDFRAMFLVYFDT